MPEDTIPDGTANEELLRRHFVRAAGAAGVAGLAGCSTDSGNGTDPGADGDGTDTTGAGSDGGTPVDPAFTNAIWDVPSEVQVNPYNQNQFSTQLSDAIFEQFVYYNSRTDEYLPGAIGDWDVGGETAEFTVREGLTWHNGDPVTSADLATNFKLDVLTGGRFSGAVDGIDAFEEVDDRTLRINFNKPQAGFLVLDDLTGDTWHATPESIYGKFVESIASASGEDATNQEISKLQQFAPPASDAVGCGLWKVSSVSQNKAVCERFEDHPQSDNSNFPRYEFLRLDSNQKRFQALRGKEVDGMGPVFASAAIAASMPRGVDRVTLPAFWGFGMVVNHNDKHLGKKAVRQAITYVVDREQVVANAGPNVKSAVGIPAGCPSYVTGTAKQWTDPIKGKLTDYQGNDTEAAAAVLRDAGYSKNGDGIWVDGSGDPIDAPLRIPGGWNDWVISAQTIASQLREFGIQSEAVNTASSDYFGRFSDADFKLIARGWAAGSPHPYFTQALIWGKATGQDSFTVPAEVEAETLSGSTETLSPKNIVDEIPALTEDSEIESRIHELAKLYNDFLPMIPIQEKENQNWITTDDWVFPPEGSDKLGVSHPVHYLNRTGAHLAKTK